MHVSPQYKEEDDDTIGLFVLQSAPFGARRNQVTKWTSIWWLISHFQCLCTRYPSPLGEVFFFVSTTHLQVQKFSELHLTDIASFFMIALILCFLSLLFVFHSYASFSSTIRKTYKTISFPYFYLFI